MTKPPAYVAALLALTLPAAAQAGGEIAVTAGEHGDHSRIVVSAGAGPISVTRADMTVGLHFSPREAAFNLSDINERRKARRVVGANAMTTPAGPVVRLQLGCDCRLDQQRLPDGRFVIDIYDKAPPAAGETAPQAVAAKKEPPKPAASITEKDDLSIEQARSRMIELLQQAADDGLITIKDGAPQLTGPTPLTPVAASHKEAAPALSPAKADIIATEPPRPAVGAVHSCLPDAAFAIDGATVDADPLGAITALQAGLAEAPAGGEGAAADALADGYLAIGFGEEALASLEEYGQSNSLRADMARIVAERPVSDAGIIVAADGCRGAHALWQAAAADSARAAAAAKRSGDAVSALPKRLRAALAARIARKMIDAGDWTEARRFYAAASAAAPAPTPDLQFISAKLLEHDGAGAEAEQLMQEVAATGADASKDALLALADRYAETGAAPPDGFVEDIGALAKTEQGTARGDAAALREARMWADEGNIEASIMLLKNAARADPAAASAAGEIARSILLKAFFSAEESQNAKALDAYLQNKTFVDAGAGNDFSSAAARAATALGVPNAAVRILPARAGAAGAMQRAEALLAADDPARALEAAAPYAEDPAFAALIVEANLALEQNFAALAAASSLADAQQKALAMANAAWRAGDWASAMRAFEKIDPTRMTADMAKRYALAAYMTGARAMPPAAEAALRAADAETLAGLQALFGETGGGSIIDRGKAAVTGADEELNMIEEVLSDG